MHAHTKRIVLHDAPLSGFEKRTEELFSCTEKGSFFTQWRKEMKI